MPSVAPEIGRIRGPYGGGGPTLRDASGTGGPFAGRPTSPGLLHRARYLVMGTYISARVALAGVAAITLAGCGSAASTSGAASGGTPAASTSATASATTSAEATASPSGAAGAGASAPFPVAVGNTWIYQAVTSINNAH